VHIGSYSAGFGVTLAEMDDLVRVAPALCRQFLRTTPPPSPGTSREGGEERAYIVIGPALDAG
jgi:hypothetical protein